MGIIHSPSIVLDKLAFYMDALSPKCYSGSGTTVNDISGNGYNGTLNGLGSQVSYNASVGSFDFTGANGASIAYPESNISKDPSLILTGVSGEITHEAWCFPTSITSLRRIMSTDRSDFNCLMWSSNNKLEWSVDNAQFNSNNNSFSANKWWHIVATASRAAGTTNNILIYRNGELIKTNSRNLRNPMGDGTARPFAIGSNVEGTVSNNNCFIGKIAIIRIYGKALSAVEIKQNYNASRGRFGL